jgi:putative oxidoreductase
MAQKLINFWKKSVAFAKKCQWIPVALTRITIGITFAQTGWGKLHSLDQVIEFFKSLGIPAAEIQAPFVASVEFGCGLMILFGLGTRIASIPLIGTMVVAILTAKMADITTFTDIFGFIEYLYIVMLLFLITSGPGRFSLDHLIAKKTKSV